MSSANDNTERVFGEHPRSLKGAWWFLRATFLLCAFLEIVVSVISYFEIRALGNGSYYATGLAIEPSEAGIALHAVSTSAEWTYSLIWLLCIIAYARFFQRSMRNLYIHGVDGLTIGPAWTWGWFFIPIANLWLPFRAARQVFEGSISLLGESKPSIVILRWWWAAWLTPLFIGIVMGIVVAQFAISFEDFNEADIYINMLISGILSRVINLSAIFLVLNFSSKIFQAQEAYFRTM